MTSPRVKRHSRHGLLVEDGPNPNKTTTTTTTQVTGGSPVAATKRRYAVARNGV